MTTPGRYAADEGTFAKSAGSAAARGGVLIAVAVTFGLTLDGKEALVRHFLLGLFTVCFTCFIHVLVMFYLIGTGKDIRDAVEESPELGDRFIPLTRQLKRLVFPRATLALFLSVFGVLMGGEIHSRVISAPLIDGQYPIRALGGWWVHAALTGLAILANAWAFFGECRAARLNRRAIQEINAALAEAPSSETT